MAYYRKIPLVIEAIQWNGNSNREQIFEFIGKRLETVLVSETAYVVGKGAPLYALIINTKEGKMEASPFDFIIKGVNGEFYPCKPDIFEKSYEAEI